MSAGLARAALLVALSLAPLVALSLAPLGARAETWDAVELAEAEELRAAEAARAAAYRARVARGDVRAAAAPMPRDAPQAPDASAGDALREAADIVDLLERWFGRVEDEAAAPRDERRRDRGAR